MTRLLLLAAAIASASAFVARAPLAFGGSAATVAQSPAPLPALARVPSVRHAKIVAGLGEAMETEAPDETCIEDEAVEECVSSSFRCRG